MFPKENQAHWMFRRARAKKIPLKSHSVGLGNVCKRDEIRSVIKRKIVICGAWKAFSWVFCTSFVTIPGKKDSSLLKTHRSVAQDFAGQVYKSNGFNYFFFNLRTRGGNSLKRRYIFKWSQVISHSYLSKNYMKEVGKCPNYITY